MPFIRIAAASAITLTAAVAPAPAGACDPDVLDEHLTELCHGPLRDVSQMLAAARPSPEAGARLRQAIEAAQAACADRAYEAGLSRAVRIAFEIGRLDPRKLAGTP